MKYPQSDIGEQEVVREQFTSDEVFNVEPYASELLPYLHFSNERSARYAAQELYDGFMRYREQEDVVGMDMARKFLEIGWLRTRHHVSQVNHLLHSDSPLAHLPGRRALAMADASKTFHRLLQQARNDPMYRRLIEQRRTRV